MFDLETDVSRETIARLETFAKVLLKWTAKINLVSPSTVPDIWNRHIVDSAQIYPYDPGPHWLDLGSGGGLPGVVCAIIAAEKHPDTKFTLVESDQRKATFLRTAFRTLALEHTVLAKRVEDIAGQQASCLTARALKPLPALLPMAERHLQNDGLAIFPKGKTYGDELREAQQNWHFDVTLKPSMTDENARIIELRNIRRVDQ
jgi:16S rRNA (guanine527-N7)-methyltransferase